MKELIFFPLPNEIKIEPDLIPLHILPKEKISINLVYRGTEIKTEDTFLTAKIIDGTISTKDLRIPYSCEVMKCPLEFSAKKIDFPALQIDEKVSTSISIKNIAAKDIIIEFFLPEYPLCGLKMTTMVSTIPPQKKIDINFEYSSFFKKLGAFTLLDLQQKYEKDEKRNFDYRMSLVKVEEDALRRKEEEKKQESALPGAKKGQPQAQPPKKDQPPPQPPKKDQPQAQPQKNLSKKQQQELELELQRQAELDKQREEDERLKRIELEKNFDMKEGLLKLGGKFYEFNEGEKNYSQQYVWLVPCYFKFVGSNDLSKSVVHFEISTVSVEKSLVVSSSLIDFGEIAVGVRKVED